MLINNHWKAYKNRDFLKYNHCKEKVQKETKKSKHLVSFKENIDFTKKEHLLSLFSNFKTTENCFNTINEKFASIFE